MGALVVPHSFAVFMDGPACGKVRKVVGRPKVIQAPCGDVIVVYQLRRAYADNGLAVIFYSEVCR